MLLRVIQLNVVDSLIRLSVCVDLHSYHYRVVCLRSLGVVLAISQKILDVNFHYRVEALHLSSRILALMDLGSLKRGSFDWDKVD